MADDLEQRVAKLEAEVAGISRLENKIDKLIERMDKVVTLEQNHLNQNGAIARAFEGIKEVDAALKEHMHESDLAHRAIDDIVSRGRGAWWVASILWGVIGMSVVGGLLAAAKEIVDLRAQAVVHERLLTSHMEKSVEK